MLKFFQSEKIDLLDFLQNETDGYFFIISEKDYVVYYVKYLLNNKIQTLKFDNFEKIGDYFLQFFDKEIELLYHEKGNNENKLRELEYYRNQLATTCNVFKTKIELVRDMRENSTMQYIIDTLDYSIYCIDSLIEKEK